MAGRVIRRVVPHGRRQQLRALYNRATWRTYSGRAVACNCCWGSFRCFREYVGVGGHRALMCPRCGSLGRHRVDWLYVTAHTDLLRHPARLLHVAPEPCLRRALRTRASIAYRSGDYDSKLAMDRIDIRSMPYRDGSFDAVICNHVLQHVDDDLAALDELHRVLTPGGWALLQGAVDLSRVETVDETRPPPASARYEEVFMHRYGRDYTRRVARAGFEVTVSDFVRELAPSVQRRLGLDPDETIFFCRRRAGGGG